MLSPFSDVRTIDVLDQDGSRYGFLVLVLDGAAAVVRVPRVLGLDAATGTAFDEVRDHLLARLRVLTQEQRIAFHRAVDETADPYLLIDRIASLTPATVQRSRPAGLEEPQLREVSTGFRDLDEATGGLRPGDLWVVAGEPGQGRSTLLAQWAARLASTTGWETWLVSPRDDTAAVTARLVANRGKVPLNHLQQRRLSEEERAVADRVQAELRAAGLAVHGPNDRATPAGAVRAFREGHGPDVLLVDDVEHSGWTAPTLRMVADAGVLVIAESCDLPGGDSPAAAWLRAADAVLVVRTRGPAGGVELVDGVGELSLIRNRRGPVRNCRIYFDGCYARFRGSHSRPGDAAHG